VLKKIKPGRLIKEEDRRPADELDGDCKSLAVFKAKAESWRSHNGVLNIGKLKYLEDRIDAGQLLFARQALILAQECRKLERFTDCALRVYSRSKCFQFSERSARLN
jgi:hypothetical protein